ncbi:MAG: hypothetical protein ACRDRW_18795 [Pseudonocardiaceae bacterium]
MTRAIGGKPTRTAGALAPRSGSGAAAPPSPSTRRRPPSQRPQQNDPQQPRCRPRHPSFVATVTDAVLTTLGGHHQEASRTGHTSGTRDAHGKPPQESQVKAGIAPTT